MQALEPTRALSSSRLVSSGLVSDESIWVAHYSYLLPRDLESHLRSALVFVSHKFHCVTPVTAGRRHVLVMELWEGEERECAHRCERHTGPCSHSVRASFWRRAFSDLASDL